MRFVTLASLTLKGNGQEVVRSSDLAWCRSVEEQLDSAASVCVVEIGKLEAGGADDLAWVQSPRVRLRKFMSSTLRLQALVAGAAPSLRLRGSGSFGSKGLRSACCGAATLPQSPGSPPPSAAPTSPASSFSPTPSCTSFRACPCHIGLFRPACGAWRGCGSLTELSIEAHGVTSLQELAGAGASQLKSLHFCACDALTSLEPLHACDLSRLTRLHRCRALQSLGGLGTLPALVLLDLSDCGALTSLHPVLDAGAVSLRDVNLCGCWRRRRNAFETGVAVRADACMWL